MKTIWITVFAMAVAALPSAAQTLRVGTFHQPSVVVAYYRSPLWAQIMKAKMAEMEAAKKANQTSKVQELEAWGQSHQEQSHHQLSGEAPITNILEALKPAFPEIAAKAQVAAIAADLPYTGTVQTVDVTGQILDWLQADENTRRIVKELQAIKGPIPPLH